MDRKQAAQILRDELNKHGLTDWSVRLNQNADSRFLGMCSYKDKCIILSAHHIDIHPDPDVINTIRHEIAHALCPGHAHDYVWAAKAREIGCDNTLPCSNLSLSPEVINAIRSGSDVEVTFDEHIVRVPKYQVTRLQDKCPVCSKVAVTKSEKTIEMPGEAPDMRLISLECGHTVSRFIPKGTPFHLFQMGGLALCTDGKGKHEFEKNKCMKCGRFRPYDFQLEAMRFVEAGLAVNKGAADFDEMGLGKTIVSGGVVYHNPDLWPCLWIVKSGLKYQFSSFIINWMNESPTKPVKGWKDNVHIPQIINSSKDWLIPGLKHYIVGYDMLVPKTRTLKNGTVVNQGFDIKKFDDIGIKCVVLDECQQIKNVDSTRTQMVRKVVKERKVIALSGTPWNNRGSELFPVLNMLAPLKFSNYEKFKRDWVSYYNQGPYVKEGGIKRIEQFKEYTKDICIRRERTEVMSELPLVNRTKLNVVMDEGQEAVYDEAVEEFVRWYEEQQNDISGMHLLAAMAKMRHLVALAKIPTTLEYVNEFVEDTDRKLVVFAHHKDVQVLLHDEIKTAHGDKILVLKLDADLNGEQRYEVQQKFNQATRAIMVASQLASGEGLNLQTCSDCIMHERQWNPGKEEQCEGRFIRIGQVATSVNAIYAHMEGLTAIDQQLDAIVERKRIQFHNAMNKGEVQAWNGEALIKELATSIVNAHNAKKHRQQLKKVN